LENPRKFNFTASALLNVQSIATGCVFSCPKHMDASVSNIIAVIVPGFVVLVWFGSAIAPVIYHPITAVDSKNDKLQSIWPHD
jgi:hypothetical protein